jgi:hypothetical protein
VKGVQAYGDRDLNIEIEGNGSYAIIMEVFWNKNSTKVMGKEPIGWVATSYGPEKVDLN